MRKVICLIFQVNLEIQITRKYQDGADYSYVVMVD